MIFNRRKANMDELSSTGKGIPRENSVAVGTAIIAVVLILCVCSSSRTQSRKSSASVNSTTRTTHRSISRSSTARSGIVPQRSGSWSILTLTMNRCVKRFFSNLSLMGCLSR